MHPVQVPKRRYLLSKEMSNGVHKVSTPGVTRFFLLPLLRIKNLDLLKWFAVTWCHEVHGECMLGSLVVAH